MAMKRATTYLDFGMTRGGKRACYDYREGQNAYDLFMGARYLADLIAYRECRIDDVYHPEDLRDQLRKHTALSVCRRDGQRLTYHEIGSSVMGVIDALEYLNREFDPLETRAIAWYGVDNSTFMNAMARYTHESYDIRVAERVSVVACDLFFSKGVSLLYAIESEDLLTRVLDASRIAVFDYTFTTAARTTDVVGTGLPVTYLNLDECRRRLDRPGRSFVLNPYTIRTYHQSPDKVTFDCVYGDTALVERYSAEMAHRSEEYVARMNRPLVRPPA
jgi:hypothetical protein